jgi:hypothetical protein
MISWEEFISNITDENILQYLKTLDEKDRNIMLIAHDHLESSFSIKYSNGYNNWLKTISSS